jgi:hypothetical protein
MADTARLARRRQLARTEEITELKPAREMDGARWRGPLTATAKTTIEPLDVGQKAGTPSRRFRRLVR